MTGEAKTALACQVVTGLLVAARGADREGIPWAFSLRDDGTCGGSTRASAVVPGGMTVVHVVEPGVSPEGLVGVAKSLYTARCQGEAIPESVLRVFAAHLVRPERGKVDAANKPAQPETLERPAEVVPAGEPAAPGPEAEAEPKRLSNVWELTAEEFAAEATVQPTGPDCRVHWRGQAVLWPGTRSRKKALAGAYGYFRSLAAKEEAEANGEEYELTEIVPLPAKCPKCRRVFTGKDAIQAPSLDNVHCFYCSTKLAPHPTEPAVESAKARRRRRQQQAVDCAGQHAEATPADPCPWCGLVKPETPCPQCLPCPACGAGPGVSCRLPNGEPADRLHAGRYPGGEGADLDLLVRHAEAVAVRYEGSSVTCYCDACEAARLRLRLPRWPGVDGDGLPGGPRRTRDAFTGEPPLPPPDIPPADAGRWLRCARCDAAEPAENWPLNRVSREPVCPACDADGWGEQLRLLSCPPPLLAGEAEGVADLRLADIKAVADELAPMAEAANSGALASAAQDSRDEARGTGTVCEWCGGEGRGTCPHAVACPDCGVPPGARCKRPSGHPAGAMHQNRYRASEKLDGAACPGFEPVATPHGEGCRHCSGLRDDHPAAVTPAQPEPEQPEPEKPEMVQRSFFGDDE